MLVWDGAWDLEFLFLIMLLDIRAATNSDLSSAELPESAPELLLSALAFEFEEGDSWRRD